MVYPALLPLMRTPRLPVVDWTDVPADWNGLVRFAERRKLVSARVITFRKQCTNCLALDRPPRLNLLLSVLAMFSVSASKERHAKSRRLWATERVQPLLKREKRNVNRRGNKVTFYQRLYMQPLYAILTPNGTGPDWSRSSAWENRN